MAFRVTRRVGEAAFTPEYQAATTVRSSAKASTATAMPQDGERGPQRVPDGIAPGEFEHSCQFPVVSGQLMELQLEDHAPPGFPGPSTPRR